MNSKQYVARSAAIAARVLGDETMVVSAVNSTLFTLDGVATVIWESADGATPLEDIVTHKICTQYDVAPEIALNDAQRFVEGLAQHGLMLLSDRPMTEPITAPEGTK